MNWCRTLLLRLCHDCIREKQTPECSPMRTVTWHRAGQLLCLGYQAAKGNELTWGLTGHEGREGDTWLLKQEFKSSWVLEQNKSQSPSFIASTVCVLRARHGWHSVGSRAARDALCQGSWQSRRTWPGNHAGVLCLLFPHYLPKQQSPSAETAPQQRWDGGCGTGTAAQSRAALPGRAPS